jgi:hypothetical protein
MRAPLAASAAAAALIASALAEWPRVRVAAPGERLVALVAGAAMTRRRAVQ